MLPQVGSVVGPRTPTRMEIVTQETFFMGKRETHTGPRPVSTLTSMIPGYSRGHSPVTGGNDVDDASRGHAGWLGNRLTFSGEGRQNYYFIPAAVDKVSFVVIIPDTLAIGGYIVSDNYGGCEYHIATNSATMEIALMHVYRGSSGLAKYRLGANWKIKSEHRSKDLVEQLPMKIDNPGQRDGSVLSISYIPPCQLWRNFSVQTAFIAVNSTGLVTHALPV